MERLINMSDATAKSILLALCADDTAQERRALEFLDNMEALDGQVAASEGQRVKKRKAQSPTSICVQCQSPFHEEDNNDRACRYHRGKLYANYESGVWDDHDEDCHGEIDTLENRLEYPEGFVWTCCDKLGYRGGCTRGKHNARGTHRGKYGDKPGTDLVEDSESAGE